MTSRLNLRPVSFWPFTPLDEVAQASSFTCSEGRLAPRGRVHCNDFRSEHRCPRVAANRPRFATKPAPSEEGPPASLADARQLDRGRNFTPGRLGSPLGAEAPPSSAAERRCHRALKSSRRTGWPKFQVRPGRFRPGLRELRGAAAFRAAQSRREAVWTVPKSWSRKRDRRSDLLPTAGG